MGQQTRIHYTLDNPPPRGKADGLLIAHAYGHWHAFGWSASIREEEDNRDALLLREYLWARDRRYPQEGYRWYRISWMTCLVFDVLTRGVVDLKNLEWVDYLRTREEVDGLTGCPLAASTASQPEPQLPTWDKPLLLNPPLEDDPEPLTKVVLR